MIPEGKVFTAKIVETFYKDGKIITEYRVYVPDFTRSGDYRFEHVQTVQEVESV